ncbi:carbohydrate sulfotransferase 10 [Aplysia californica]|uniref:Carbohydrate sulfotransferase n=1 Tax=Aplysia californica TaxID=6500 RepID=A0ABM1VYZ6_APLCA|nr:carbohydrate sulfotransferase 10 [Aplysia californica]XP_035827640.1 carbohydrate sulfotransferase 10 [Aplysia californica]
MRSMNRIVYRISLPVAFIILLGTLFYVHSGAQRYIMDIPSDTKREMPPAVFIEEPERMRGALTVQHENISAVNNNADLNIVDNFIQSRLEARKEHLRRACSRIEVPKSVARQRGLEVSLAHGKIKLCGLEKVGSTFMKGLHALEEKEDVKPSNVTEFKSFVMVRDPYKRLISGYVDKIFTRTEWWLSHGRDIVRNFRLQPSQKSLKCGSDVTFAEFVKYFIHTQETGKEKNGHFKPMSEECRFCYFDYDFIAHLETVEDDLAYIYESMNATLKGTLNDEEVTLKDKASTVVSFRDSVTKCENMCTMLSRTWWSFHARGLIAMDLQLPVKGEDCNTITPQEFADIAWDAHQQSVGRVDVSKQRRQMMASLYLQLPLSDRLKVRKLLQRDFDLFGYESTPPDLFPELQKNSENGRGSGQNL